MGFLGLITMNKVSLSRSVQIFFPDFKFRCFSNVFLSAINKFPGHQREDLNSPLAFYHIFTPNLHIQIAYFSSKYIVFWSTTDKE